MRHQCLAHSSLSGCFVVSAAPAGPSPDPAPGTVSIRASVGAGGHNQASDVRAVQAGLNRVPDARGGPKPPLVVDGIVGPLTVGAIKAFQKLRTGVSDGRVDPNGPTLGALNAELDAQAADPEVVALVLRQLKAVREVIRAAQFRIAAAEPFLRSTLPNGGLGDTARTSFRMLDAAFSLSRFRDPMPPFDNIRRVFRNMDVALNRSFETDPLIAPILFTPNTHQRMEARAAAYTTRGGAFLTDQDLLDGIAEPANRIYVCRNLLKAPDLAQVATLVHELAHFVSGQPIELVDVIKKGHMLKLAERKRFDELPPKDKIRSAENHAFFAMISRHPRLMTEGI